ncbi:DUF2145 domain-containing protein [Polaromonas naphthalenivorans]|uniref:Outer membrane protein n=1 Tax=Polaromonas naphthalenivorans (strain CJ2) TaxID=365044 RepID=A1VJ06_POLNA|nr:DUF2145 domain-containing protein [Polaromonas naphthalenivorans]ABM35634.1 conserved hypothetical protein [Polaromonas naphthalenivorans CJ2]
MNTRLNHGLGMALLAGSLILPVAAHAGRSCQARPPTTQSVELGLALAEKTLASLNASGERVVLLARAGQDLSRYGLRYSHFGLAWQVADGQGGNTWHVLHKLNGCGTAEAALYRQGLGEFFLDDPWRFEAAWLAPTPQVQARLLALLQDSRRAISLNHRPYSIVSYAWGRKYQQSNQWAIETLAAALEPGVTSREKAQAWLQFRGYEPTTLHLGPLTRLGGRLTAANIAFDDHPNDKRFADRIETVTVDSVFAWLARAQLSRPGKAPTLVGP